MGWVVGLVGVEETRDVAEGMDEMDEDVWGRIDIGDELD